MARAPEGDLTELLRSAQAGEAGALDRILPVVYQELRALAESVFRQERSDHTLQATALVHEAYLRLVAEPNLAWEGRRHFFGIAATAMRRILVDHARSRKAHKRDGGAPVTLDRVELADPTTLDDVLGVDEALGRLADVSPRAARVVELRYFAGLSVEETAATLEVSPATVKRDWVTAKAWLHRELA